MNKFNEKISNLLQGFKTGDRGTSKKVKTKVKISYIGENCLPKDKKGGCVFNVADPKTNQKWRCCIYYDISKLNQIEKDGICERCESCKKVNK